MFNLYKQLRYAALAAIFIGIALSNLAVTFFGLILMAAGTVGATDLTERRVELLEKILLDEKKETTNEETDAH